MKPSAKRNTPTRNDVRLLPAVAGVAAILLCLKAGGLAFEASAATAPAPAQKAAAQPATPPAPAPQSSPAPTAPAPAADPLAAINSALPMPANRPPVPANQTPQAAAPAAAASADSGVSQAEMDVLTSLAGRRGALDDRQRELDLKANVIAAAEKRVDEKITQLKALQAQIEALMGQREQRETQQLDGLVRVYAAMKPRDAARIFASLDDDVRINVAGRMKPDTMAGILAALPAEVAQKLTVELATRYRAPAAAAAASAAPPAAAPTAARGPERAMRSRTRTLFRIALCAAMAALPPIAFGQPSGDRVAVDTKAGYARILFTFEEPAPVEAAIADGVLTIELKRPVDTTIEALIDNLDRYVSVARQDRGRPHLSLCAEGPVGPAFVDAGQSDGRRPRAEEFQRRCRRTCRESPQPRRASKRSTSTNCRSFRCVSASSRISRA